VRLALSMVEDLKEMLCPDDSNCSDEGVEAPRLSGRGLVID
jgi:hypothetical protein